MQNEGAALGKLLRRNPREVLADNVTRLRKWHKERRPGSNLGTQKGVAAASGLSQPSIGRMERGGHATELDSIEAIAKAFKVEAWQLLCRDLDPEDLYVPLKRSIYERIRAAIRGFDDSDIPPPTA